MRWNDRIGRRIKLGDLHILLAVAQSGSMAKAASELAVSHPVVSRSIRELEQTLGVRLLDRNPHGVELTDELWVLPPLGSRFGSLARDIFDAQELPCPRASVLATALEMTINLLRTDRYLAIVPESVLNFPAKHPFIRKLPVELPIVSG